MRDLIIGDEIWVYLDMKPGDTWLPGDAELPVHGKRTIASENRMLIVFWGLHEIAHYCSPQKDNTLDSPFFYEKVLRPLTQKMQPNSKKSHKPLALICIDNARVHTTRVTQEKVDVSRLKRTLQPPYSQGIAPFDFFSVG
jgi:hypothetical protein